MEKCMLADFVLLNKDLYSCPAAEILHTRVLRTWGGGECVYCMVFKCCET